MTEQKWKSRLSSYNRFPSIPVDGFEGEVWKGLEEIGAKLKEHAKASAVYVLDCYPGVEEEEIISLAGSLNPELIVNAEEIWKEKEEVNGVLKNFLTEDRVFGRMYYGEFLDFVNQTVLDSVRKKIEQQKQAGGVTVVYGVGASLVTKGDLLVYLDLSRWEIQLRYRKGMGNFRADNEEEETLKKFKRGYFFEWRVADKHKSGILDTLHYLIDCNKKGSPVMVSGSALRHGLKQAAARPFRTVPYFDPGVWGGQWMKQVCGLDSDRENYAWSFDGVPEENSLLLDFGSATVEIPAMDLVLYQPKELLGDSVYARFGAEFPIRFDFLDTMEGGNLSLQVHPLTDYVKKQFGMAYTQDESYYILDAGEDAVVYLGLREGIAGDEMIQDLKEAQQGKEPFAADKYINVFPAKKHDHFLIPAGTCHCSGKNAMVLEISATPYIFTFKLWDWGRVGLDGRPRPIHIEHGSKVIQWDRTTKWVEENLVNAIYPVYKEDGYLEEHTGLHRLEFIETRRHWLEKPVELDTKGTVHMMNLVEGKTVRIESVDGSFPPFEVNYVETFVIPASVGRYRLCPVNGPVGVIDAFVRD